MASPGEIKQDTNTGRSGRWREGGRGVLVLFAFGLQAIRGLHRGGAIALPTPPGGKIVERESRRDKGEAKRECGDLSSAQ